MLAALDQKLACFHALTPPVTTVDILKMLVFSVCHVSIFITLLHCQPWGFCYLTIAGCTSGTIRLVGGTYSSQGRVEVCVNRLWSTVCSHSWTAIDANVACRQLGYSGSGKCTQAIMLTSQLVQFSGSFVSFYLCKHTDATAYTSANFGQGTLPILLDDVACTVYESRLIDCPYSSQTSDCTHSLDAGVQCVARKLH